MRIEFNLITQRETVLDSPLAWYGSLAVLGAVIPLLVVAIIIGRYGALRAIAATVSQEDAQLAARSKPRWTRARVDSMTRKMAEATSVTRRCALRPARVIRALTALVPDGVRVTRLDLGSADQLDKTIAGIALSREALSQLMANLSGPGRSLIGSFELRSEQRHAAGGAAADSAPSQSGALRFSMTFELAGGGL